MAWRVRWRLGFTLLELLAAVAIIGILIALAVPAIQQARHAASRAQCANNLRQISFALHGYHDSLKSFPPGIRGTDDAYPFMGWEARLLPYLEQTALWNQADKDYKARRRFREPPAQHVDLATIVPVFICPADGRESGLIPEGGYAAFTHYLGVSGSTRLAWNGMLYFNSRVAVRDVIDGTSNTVIVGERPPSFDNRFGWWYAGVGQEGDGDADMVLSAIDFCVNFRHPSCLPGPYYYGPGRTGNLCDTYHFWSQHTEGAHFLFVDGSARFLDYSARSILPALATRAGGEPVGAF